jgi:hypothetical protein
MSSHGIATPIVEALDFENHTLMFFFDSFYDFSCCFWIAYSFLL